MIKRLTLIKVFLPLRALSWFLCLSVLCPFFCWGEQVKLQAQNEDEALFINRIADFWEEGEYQIAKSQIQKFLTLYPKSSFTDTFSSCLGDLLLREKNYSSALDYYAKITDPEIESRIFPHRLQCLYALQWYAILADECEAHLQKSLDDRMQVVYYLAIALYHQCLNATNDPEGLLTLAKRAKPYFEELFSSSLKPEVASAFAHLLCILKEFPQAAEIYSDLAKTENSAEMFFQAAFVQAEYDKELALQTFESIVKSDHELMIRQEAAYNCLILSFDLKKYETIINSKEALLENLPEAKISLAHLFIGRSFLAMQNYEKASTELKIYIASQSFPSESLHSALLALTFASVEAKDFDNLNTAIEKIEAFYPNDEELLKGKFSRALLLKELNKLDLAKNELENLFSLQSSQNPEILLELIHTNEQMHDWISCRSNALQFLLSYPNHEHTRVAESYLVSASSEIGESSLSGKQQLILDLENLLNKTVYRPIQTIYLWKYILAKTHFKMGEYTEALSFLLEITEKGTDGEMQNDALLLIALCYRDGFQDLKNFIFYGEKALSQSNDPIGTGSLHAALYNAYLELSFLEKAKEHLFNAFKFHTPIENENLLWLSDCFIASKEYSQAIFLLESMDPIEQVVIRLSKVYYADGQTEKALPLLETLSRSESLNKNELHETKLLLGEILASFGEIEKAKNLLDSIYAEKSNLKTFFGASACLQSARLQARKWQEKAPSIDDPQFGLVLVQLKDLVIQKNIAFEPLYLESALDYISLQEKCHISDEKRLSLLQKTKRDFESEEDLLSQDYHIGRKGLPEQNFIYESYMRFLEAQILNIQSKLNLDADEQKELQAKAKDLLLRIIEEKAHPALVARANQCLCLDQ